MTPIPVDRVEIGRRGADASTSPGGSRLQQPDWPDPGELMSVRRRLATLPALVAPGEVRCMRRVMSTAAHGDALVLQAGDCAEAFGANRASVQHTVNLLGAMARVLTRATGLPVVRVGRLAGQYSKPRSSPVEEVDGRLLPSFRGHSVNHHAPDPLSRRPDPGRLLRAYDEAAATLRLLRASATAGSGTAWASHEALLLDYEEPLVRWDPRTAAWYSGSGHLLWIGERTRQVDGAHVRLLAGLGNAVAVKLGPRTTVDEVCVLGELLDPHRQPGRLTFISRMGRDVVGSALPPLVRAVREAGHPVIWLCDPMHGNTTVDRAGRKTRHVTSILGELGAFVGVLRDEGVRPGGLHLELTGEDVEECADRPGEVLPPGRSTTLCDPRLNSRQGLEVARAMGDALRRAARPAC